MVNLLYSSVKRSFSHLYTKEEKWTTQTSWKTNPWSLISWSLLRYTGFSSNPFKSMIMMQFRMFCARNSTNYWASDLCDTERTTLLFPPPLSSVLSIFGPKISLKNFLVTGIWRQVCDSVELLLCFCYVYMATVCVHDLSDQKLKIKRYFGVKKHGFV